MKKHSDEELNLEELLIRCKQMDPLIRVRIYYDPAVRWFYISFLETMAFWIPNDASFLFECEAARVGAEIEMFISQAMRKISEEAAS